MEPLFSNSPYGERRAEAMRNQSDQFIGDDVFKAGLGRVSAVDDQGDNNKQPILANLGEIAMNAVPNMANTLSKNISNLTSGIQGMFGNDPYTPNISGEDLMNNPEFQLPELGGQPMLNVGQAEDVVQSQGLGKASNFLKNNAGNIVKGLSAGASIYNSVQANKQLDSSMSNIRDSINDLTNVKSEISSQYSDDIMRVNEDLSEGMQMNALNLVSQVKMPEVNTNLSTGRASQVANDAIDKVSQRLDLLFSSQKQKSKDIADQLKISADSSMSKVSSSIDSLQTELGKMEQAKKNNKFNAIVDGVTFASSFVDPTGGLVSGTIGNALKKSNEYS